MTRFDFESLSGLIDGESFVASAASTATGAVKSFMISILNVFYDIFLFH